MRSLLLAMMVVCTAAVSQAYMIQGLDVEVDYWAGAGSNACVVAVDWNSTNGPYASQFHLFGYRWDDVKTVKDALIEIDAVGALEIIYGYGGGFITHIIYDQTLLDGDYHTSAAFDGWWWCGQTQDGGKTWDDNMGSITQEYLWNGGIECINIDGFNWGSQNMTIPEPATMLFLAIGAGLLMRKKA